MNITDITHRTLISSSRMLYTLKTNVTRLAALMLLCAVFSPAVIAYAVAGHPEQSAARRAQADSLLAVLAVTTLPDDSIRLLYDLYDISLRNDQMEIAEKIYNLARKNNNREVQFDIIRQVAAANMENDSALKVIEREVTFQPKSDLSDEALVFTHILQAALHSKTVSQDERKHILDTMLQRYVKEIEQDTERLQRIETLYIICIYLRNDSYADFISHLLGELQSLIDELPDNQYAIRNLFYTRSAQVYTMMGRKDKAVKSDKDLLRIMDNLTERYREQGRKLRNYETNRYISYRRMLANYEAMTPKEINHCAEMIDRLTAINPDVADDRASNHLSDIYLAMARKQYGKALELLRPKLASPEGISKNYKPVLLSMAIEAAKATHDDSTLFRALTLENDYLRSQLSNEASLNVIDLVKQISDLKDSNVEAERRTHRNNLVIVVCAAVLALLTAVLIYRLYTRASNLAQTLAARNDELKSERDHLKEVGEELRKARDEARAASRVKTDFIHNMSHEVREPLQAIAGYSQLIVDYVTDDNRPYLQNFANIVTINIDLMQALVNDVLQLAEGDHGKMSVEMRPASVDNMCRMSLDSQRRYVQPGVIMRYDRGDMPDININTDRRRVEQVLVNLLNNAAKFTPSGSITLSCSLSEDSKSITFAVTDTGIGIPSDMREKIFDRFEQIDSSVKGSGLGLNICRLVARLLHGEVWVDPKYTTGSRFLFRIPTNIK